MNDDIFGGMFKPELLNDDKNKHLWDKLILQIIAGNVIPVVGADLLIDAPVNIHQGTINSLAQSFGIYDPVNPPTSFSDIVFHKEYLNRCKKDEIYTLINRAFSQKRFEPSLRLKKLLSIKQFPFVITTSFTPVVEDAMRKIWGDELKVMKFNNNPKENDDIRTEEDLHKPTVYYMFGKVGDDTNRYVLTDTNMLEFCSSWLSESTRPKVLCSCLRDKYLLMLGNNYSDWLFRFIWFSMRKVGTNQCMLAYENLDNRLINFLERVGTFTHHNSSDTDVIDRIINRLEEKTSNERAKFNRPQENTDVFISYSRSDSTIADKLYENLTAHGLNVWYDRKNISTGGVFLDEINKAIRTTRYFIPILSANIDREKNDPHVYRNEWDTAITTATGMGRSFIIPLAEQGFDFYRAMIPEKIQQHNAIFYYPEEDFSEIALEIKNKVLNNS